MKKVKALVIFSGGLDSMLAIKLMQEQGIEVVALHFLSPFFGDKKEAQKKAKVLNVLLKVIDIGQEYLQLLQSPKHGFGKTANPCIDCHALMFKKAKEYMKQVKADFLTSGEVLGERPFSQNKQALAIVEKEAGVRGILLRPLSARFLPETEPEKKGLVDREKLLAISGRRRLEQLKLAKKFGIENIPTPSGGCLLTEKQFGTKVKDLLKNRRKAVLLDFQLLKVGRHFRYKNSKIVVGRNEKENKKLLKMKSADDFIFEVINIPSPISLLRGSKTEKTIKTAAQLTAFYSDFKGKQIKVKYGKKMEKQILISLPMKKEVEKLRITL